MTNLARIPRDVARKLGFYVYLYINPLDGHVFYVGKGKGQRALSHLQDTSRSRKASVMQNIRRAGKEPLIEILAHGLPDAESAFRVEAAAIDLLGLPLLSNEVRGWRTVTLGRRSLPHLVAFYRKRPITIRDPTILIRINRLYRPDMSASELYDATRTAWRVGPARERAKYAFAVFDAVVREVYEIERWLPAGSTFSSRNSRGLKSPGRWEFIGRVAPEAVRDRYVDGYVGHLFQQGAQNPIAYANVSG